MDEKKIEDLITEVRTAQTNLKADREALEAEKRAYEAEKATYAENPGMKRDNELALQKREIISAMMEKRAITVNGTGRVAFVPELVKALENKVDLVKGMRYHYGPNSSTVIPVLNPRPAVPARYAEGATSVTSDSTAVLTSTTLKPETYVSVLPISLEALKYSGANIEAELPEIFAEAFAQAILNQVVNGTGSANYQFGGLFGVTGTAVSCAASGAPTIADLVTLALKMTDLDMAEPTILISPTLYAGVTTASVSGYDFYLEELIRNKTVEGVPVVMSGKAPTTTSSGSIVAVGFDKARYNIAVGMDLAIEPLKKVGDTNTYFQATMGLDGLPTIATEVFQLTAIS